VSFDYLFAFNRSVSALFGLFGFGFGIGRLVFVGDVAFRVRLVIGGFVLLHHLFGHSMFLLHCWFFDRFVDYFSCLGVHDSLVFLLLDCLSLFAGFLALCACFDFLNDLISLLVHCFLLFGLILFFEFEVCFKRFGRRHFFTVFVQILYCPIFHYFFSDAIF